MQHADSQFWAEDELQQQVLLINDGEIKAAEVVKQMEETAPAHSALSRDVPSSEFDCGRHGLWFYWGPGLRHPPSWQARQTLESILMEEPWNVILQPATFSRSQTKSEWHRQREAQRDLRRVQLSEASEMAAHDKEVRATPERPKRQHVLIFIQSRAVWRIIILMGSCSLSSHFFTGRTCLRVRVTKPRALLRM